MKRGFPRPQMHVAKTTTNFSTDESGTTKYGLSYGEKWDDKTYPIPYTAEEHSISTLHSERLRECVVNKNCIACGEAVEEEIVTVMYQGNKIFSESGPFHEKCARLTQAMCPHININAGYTFGTVAWSEVQGQIPHLS